MPGTTRYSATFDRTYEEEDRVDPSPPTNTRRSRSLSLQASSGLDGRHYTPFGGRPPTQRSSSTDSGQPKGPEHIPTRTAKTTVKAHNNPFQFVKVGTCPLYKKAEEQLKKAKEVKKPDVLKEEEEEWQSNLDSWKSRRRKMSEDVFRRQEEIKLLELEEQVTQANQKKTKTFSEMVESRATRGRALSLCLISSPLEFQDWEYENKTHKNGSCSFTDESEGNSTVNSEDEGVSIRLRLGKMSQSDSGNIHRINGDAHIEQNGSKLKTTNGDYKKLSELSTNDVQMKPKENSYIDSGLESISSSHRAGDTPDSGSDFSPDSNSSIDCDSPRTGVNILEEFTSKASQISQDREIPVKLTVKEKGQDFGFTFLGGKDEGQVLIASLLEGSKAETCGIQLGDRIISIDGVDVSCKKHIEIVAMIQKGRENGEISLLLWRSAKSSGSTNGFKVDEKSPVKPNKSEVQNAKSYEKSVESENEMFVDDFEELQRQSKVLASSNKSEKPSTIAQAQTNGNKSPTFNKDNISVKTAPEGLPALNLKETKSNSVVEESNKNEQKPNSETNSDSQKKNVVKVKRVRRKGVYALNVSSEPTQIPQEGISSNSLFPLSPVTELPSPAEESKTMSSTLSTNNIPASSSKKEAVTKEKQKEAETKPSSTLIKEVSVPTTPSKVVKSVPPNELKMSSSEKSESKSECNAVPSSPTKPKEKTISLENAPGEKPKAATKKIKVKVKKVTASDNTSPSSLITSPGLKEGPPSPVTSTVVSTPREGPPSPGTSTVVSTPSSSSPVITSTSAVKEYASNVVAPVSCIHKSADKENTSDSKSSSQNNVKPGKIFNGMEKMVSSAKENGVTSTGTNAITPGTEALPLENKMPVIISNGIGNHSPKVVEKDQITKSSLSAIQTSGQSKDITISESEKPKPIMVKKVKIKAKGTTSDKVSTVSSKSVKEISTDSLPNNSDSAEKNLTKDNQSQQELKSNTLAQDKQIKTLNKNENTVPPQIKENIVQPEGIASVLPDSNLATVENKAINCSASVDKMKDSTINSDVKTDSSVISPVSPVTNKSLKTLQGEKSKLSLSEKKEKAKSKGNTAEQIPSESLQVSSQTSSDSNITNKSKENQLLKESQSAALDQDKKVRVENKTEKTQPTQKRDIDIKSTEMATKLLDAKIIPTEDKTLIMTLSSEKNKNLTLNIEAAKTESSKVSSTSPVKTKKPKTPTKTAQSDKSKPEIAKKKDSAKSKENTPEQIPFDAPARNSSDLSTVNFSKEIQSQSESKSTTLSLEKREKLVTKAESTETTPMRETNDQSVRSVTALPDSKSTLTNDETTDLPVPSSKKRNLKLKINANIESSNILSPSGGSSCKPPKTPPRSPRGEKSKSILLQKKDTTKPKENLVEQVPQISSALDEGVVITSTTKDLILSVGNMEKENQFQKETKPTTQSQDKKVKAVTKIENIQPTRENDDQSARSTAILPDPKSTSTNNETVNMTLPSNKTRHLKLKIDANSECTNISSAAEVSSSKPPKTPPKSPRGEKSKPALAQSKDTSKPKGDLIEQGATILSPLDQVVDVTPAKKDVALSVANTEKENLLQKETKPTTLTQEKKVKAVTKIVQPTQTGENDQSAASTDILSGTKITSNDETANMPPPTNKTKHLKLKIDANSDSTIVSSAAEVSSCKPPKTPPKSPRGEKSKSALAQNKDKPKENTKEQISLNPSLLAQDVTNTSSTKALTRSIENIATENESVTESKPTSLIQDKKKAMTKTESIEPTQTRESKIQLAGSATILPETKSTSTKDQTSNISSASGKVRSLKLKIDANIESTNISSASTGKNKPPKTPPRSPLCEKAKSISLESKDAAKPKGNTAEQVQPVALEQPVTPASKTSDLSPKIITKENQSQKDLKSAVLAEEKQVKAVTKTQNLNSTLTRENDVQSAGNTAILPEPKSASPKSKMASRNLTLKIVTNAESAIISSASAVSDSKPSKMSPKSPHGEKLQSELAQKKDSAKSKEKDNLSHATGAITANIDKYDSQKSPSTIVESHNINNNTSIASVKKTDSVNTSLKNDESKATTDMQDEKAKPSTGKKPKNRSKKKNTNSQKVIIPAKQNEELKNSNVDSLNIVFQSQPKKSCLENQSNVNKNSESSSKIAVSSDLVPDVPPVEKVAEEMEKLILEQLEEEERAKELALGLQMKGSPDHFLTAPPKLAQPPKEKPPPPPSSNETNQKETPLKRVNSTKRIKKEIHKRRSNFLGIDNADESIGNSEPSIPPPPALEEILKAEMELDRQSRLKIESASTERLTQEEKEIIRKEREIIESLESEERQRQLLNGTDDMKTFVPENSNDVVAELDRIESLKFERKRLETERLLTEEQQQIHLLEEKQLREREEFIRKQEANKQVAPLSDPSLSVTATAANTSKPAISSLTPDTKSSVSLSGANGDGKSLTNSSTDISSENAENKVPQKPAVPPKPLKKKEAIRKERERLRQEQEALQREREEHRRKLQEQEELAKQQKSHAPEAPASRLGPLPPLVQPNFPPQLTTTTPNARESASFSSRSHHGAPNLAAGSNSAVELMGPPVVRQKMPAPRKAVKNEAWGQQKQMPSVRKQNHDSLTESRYNQNHWLIQEAEMRRIKELKERQRTAQLPCSQTHLAEDDVCSNPPRVPVITPPHNPHLNYALEDKMWNYPQSNMPVKKYPPPVVKEPLHTIYPRETVSQQPPSKPSRVVPMDRQEQMLSVSGRKRCSHCNEELGRGAAMIIESLQLYYHIHCFQCCVCQAQLGNGSCGTDVRVRNNKLHCHNCYSNDEAGLKFSQV